MKCWFQVLFPSQYPPVIPPSDEAKASKMQDACGVSQRSSPLYSLQNHKNEMSARMILCSVQNGFFNAFHIHWRTILCSSFSHRGRAFEWGAAGNHSEQESSEHSAPREALTGPWGSTTEGSSGWSSFGSCSTSYRQYLKEKNEQSTKQIMYERNTNT